MKKRSKCFYSFVCTGVESFGIDSNSGCGISDKSMSGAGPYTTGGGSKVVLLQDEKPSRQNPIAIPNVIILLNGLFILYILDDGVFSSCFSLLNI